MTKEELIEMIDTTINENGSRNITGKALNLALTEIVNAMGTGSGGGGATLYCMMGQETEEQKAYNATVWAELKAMAEAGQPLPVIVIDMSGIMAAQGMTGISYAMISMMNVFDLTGEAMGIGAPALIVYAMDGQFAVLEDGSFQSLDSSASFSLNR
jgi:hypothetical protein